MIAEGTAGRLSAFGKPSVVIVGSGPIGLTLARALERRGTRVLVVESGPRSTDGQMPEDRFVIQDGDRLGSIAEARTRQVGGGLNLWGGQVGLLEKIDFEQEPKWPISRSETYAGLREALEMAGVSDERVALRLDTDESCPPLFAGMSEHNLRLVETAWLPRPKLPTRFWRDLNQSSKCVVLYDTTCVGIRADRGRVTGIDVSLDGKQAATIDANCLVLAAGTIENARLLLLPSRDKQLHPWQRCTWLGRGFNEHLDATVGSISICDARAFARIFDPCVQDGVKYLPKIAWSDRKATGTSLGIVATITYSLTASQMLDDLRLLLDNVLHHPSITHFTHLPAAVLSSALRVAPTAVRYATSRRIGQIRGSQAALRVSVEQPARHDSLIRLAPEDRDRFGVPRPVLAWCRGDLELSTIAEFASAIRRWLNAVGIAELEIDPRLLARAGEFWHSVDAGLHHAGTTRMADSPKAGVVDSNLAVFASQGLYVCGASVFPSSGYVNPTLTGMALAVRLADHITRTHVGA